MLEIFLKICKLEQFLKELKLWIFLIIKVIHIYCGKFRKYVQIIKKVE